MVTLLLLGYKISEIIQISSFSFFPDESKVAKFLFPSPLQFSSCGEIETCCPDLLHQFMHTPYSSSVMDCYLLYWLLSIVVALPLP